MPNFAPPITSFYIQKNKLQIFNSVNDSLKLIYRVIPIRYQYSFSLFDTNIITQYKIPDFALPDYYKKKKSKEEWWDAKSIAYSGTFSRGLSVGNAQSLVLNSNLNLQIQGDLGDGIKLTAAIMNWENLLATFKTTLKKQKEFQLVMNRILANGNQQIKRLLQFPKEKAIE